MLYHLVYLCYIYFLCLQEEATLIREDVRVIRTGEADRQAATIKTLAVSAAVVPYMVHMPYKEHYKLPTFMLNADLRPSHFQLYQLVPKGWKLHCPIFISGFNFWVVS